MMRNTFLSLLTAAALLAQGCASRQTVLFESPHWAKTRVTRSLISKGPNSGQMPFDVRVSRGRVYRVKITLEDEALKSLGFTAPEIERLRERKATVLEGGLVCPRLPEGSDPSGVAVLALSVADVRAALERGETVTASAHDDEGHLRALFKASTAGIALDDPDLAAHGRPVSGVLVVLGDAVTIAGVVVLFVVVAAVYVVANIAQGITW